MRLSLSAWWRKTSIFALLKKARVGIDTGFLNFQAEKSAFGFLVLLLFAYFYKLENRQNQADHQQGKDGDSGIKNVKRCHCLAPSKRIT